MKPEHELKVRCPKCCADRGVRCINLRWTMSGEGEFRTLKKSHKERIAKGIISPGAKPLTNELEGWQKEAEGYLRKAMNLDAFDKIRRGE